MLFSYIRHLPKMSPKIQYPLPNIDLSEIIVPGLEEAYPTIADDLVKEVNYYERAWSALDKAVTFYGDNDYEVETTVDVYTYGIQFDKVDKKGGKLSGAEFTLSEEGTELTFTETDTPGVYNYGLNSQNTKLVVPEGGSLQIQGLNVGTYTLKETKAPANYVLPTGEITITLTDANQDGKLEVTDSVSSTGTATVTGQIGGNGTNVVTFDVQNTSSEDAGFDLPVTGGMGTMLFTIAGILLMGGAVALVVVAVRKRRA